jgi:hypothetical protein
MPGLEFDGFKGMLLVAYDFIRVLQILHVPEADVLIFGGS